MKAPTFLCTVLTAALVLTMTVQAGVPQLINYQGRLIDSAGEPVADGTYPIIFSIYDAATGGGLRWSESQSDVAVVDGVLSAVMGAVNPLSDDVFAVDECYLEVSINGQPMAPRTRFTSVAFSQRIGTIDGATGGTMEGPLVVQANQLKASGDGIVLLDPNGNVLVDVSVNEFGTGTIALYEPTDSKAGSLVMDLSVGPLGNGVINFYEPTDSKSGFPAVASRVIEMSQNGLIMFGATEADTSLLVAPNGDIIGQGQITMGENSSSGVKTSVLGFANTASGDTSTVGGGSLNEASGTIAVVAGGHLNLSSGTGTTVSGGATNTASGQYATVAGGYDNAATGDYSVVPGGLSNSADGAHSYAAGNSAQALHDGSFVWADNSGVPFGSTGPDQFLIRATGGVGVNTEDPVGLLEVAGYNGDSSVTLPDDAIAAREIFDEPGLSSYRNTGTIELSQGSGVMEDLAVTTITVPSSGFIVLRGSATFEAYGTTGANQVLVQIDEIAGGGATAPYFSTVGTGDHDSPNRHHYLPISVERIYPVTAGTYEFRLEATASGTNVAEAFSLIQNPVITALYLPTAYGIVGSSSAVTMTER